MNFLLSLTRSTLATFARLYFHGLGDDGAQIGGALGAARQAEMHALDLHIDYSLIYGPATIGMALLTGWIASIALRRA